MYVGMHVCMRACMHVCMYACMHVCMYACMYACTHACMHVRMHVCMSACMHTCMYHACKRACMQSCMHACMSMYAHAGKHDVYWHGMHHACTCEKNPDKLGGESHRFHVHAKSMRACVDMNVQNPWTFMLKRKSCYKLYQCMAMKLRKSYYACGSMMACPTMPCHGARMRHAMRDMYACATINITCYDVYV